MHAYIHAYNAHDENGMYAHTCLNGWIRTLHSHTYTHIYIHTYIFWIVCNIVLVPCRAPSKFKSINVRAHTGRYKYTMYYTYIHIYIGMDKNRFEMSHFESYGSSEYVHENGRCCQTETRSRGCCKYCMCVMCVYACMWISWNVYVCGQCCQTETRSRGCCLYRMCVICVCMYVFMYATISKWVCLCFENGRC